MITDKLRDLVYFLSNGFSPDPDFNLDLYIHQDEISDLSLQEPRSPYGKNEKANFAAWLQRFSKSAAISIINLMENTGNSPALNVVRYQIIKSATSTAANYRAACRARSKREFFAKISIVVEECDETLYWLEILEESEIKIDKLIIKNMKPVWERILSIVSKARNTASTK